MKKTVLGGDLAIAAAFLLIWLNPRIFGADSLSQGMFIFYLSFFSLFFLTWMGTAIVMGGENRIAGALGGLAVFAGLSWFFQKMLSRDLFLNVYLGTDMGLSIPILLFLGNFLLRLARCVTDPDEPARMIGEGFGQMFLLIMAVMLVILLPWPRLGITPEMDQKALAIGIALNSKGPSTWLGPWGVVYFSLSSLATAMIRRNPINPAADPLPWFLGIPFQLCAVLSLMESLRLIGAGAPGRGLGGLLALGAVVFGVKAASRAYERQILEESQTSAT